MAGKKEKEIIEKNESEFQHISHIKKRAFLAAYAECGTVTHAAEIAGISRRMVQYWKKDDPEFAEAFRVATEKAADRLEQEARRRAIEGVSEPVFYKGRKVGTIVSIPHRYAKNGGMLEMHDSISAKSGNSVQIPLWSIVTAVKNPKE